MKPSEFEFWVGVDWGHSSHQVCVVDASGKTIWEKSVTPRGNALIAFAEELRERTGDPASVAVGLETTSNAVVDLLLERGYAVFALNPKQLDRFRDRHTVAGAKDDRRDAYVLAVSLRTDLPLYQRLELSEDEMIELRELVRSREDLLKQRIADCNRLRETLMRYYPQILELGTVEEIWVRELLERAPQPATGAALSRSAAEKILQRRRVRRIQSEEVLKILRTEPMPVPKAVTKACVRRVRMLLRSLRTTTELMTECDQAIRAVLKVLQEAPDEEEKHRDAEIILSLVGMGKITGATVLAETATLLQNQLYTRIRSVSGTAPVTRQSGKTRIVVMRRACNNHLRNAVLQCALAAVRYNKRAKEHYARQRARGNSHGQALRSLADAMLRVLTAMLKNRELFDEERWALA